MTIQQLIVGNETSFDIDTGRDIVLSVRTQAHWQVLRSPYRMRIFEAIRGSGGCSIKELADTLGGSTTALYYHLDLLSRAEMIRSTIIETVPANRGGRRPAVFMATGDRVVVEYDAANARERRRMAAIGVAWLEESQAELIPADGVQRAADALDQETLVHTTAWEVLTQAEAEEIRDSIDRVEAVLAAARARRTQDASDLKHATHHVAFTVAAARNAVLPSPRMVARPAAQHAALSSSY